MDIWIIPKENVVDKNKTMARTMEEVCPASTFLVNHA